MGSRRAALGWLAHDGTPVRCGLSPMAVSSALTVPAGMRFWWCYNAGWDAMAGDVAYRAMLALGVDGVACRMWRAACRRLYAWLGLAWVSHAAARLHVVSALHCLPRYGLAVGVKEVDRLLVALRMQQPLRMEPPECLQRSGRMLRTTLPPGVLHGMCLPPGATRCVALGRMQPAAPYGVQGVLPLRHWDVV